MLTNKADRVPSRSFWSWSTWNVASAICWYDSILGKLLLGLFFETVVLASLELLVCRHQADLKLRSAYLSLPSAGLISVCYYAQAGQAIIQPNSIWFCFCFVKLKIFLLKLHLWGYRDGSAVKNINCYFKEPGFSSQCPYDAIYNNCLFLQFWGIWPPQALDARALHWSQST